MNGKPDETEEFLGHGFVPIVLASVVVSVVTFVALGRIGHAYLTASSLIALALTARFTWDKRDFPQYRSVIACLAAGQVLIVLLLGDRGSHVPGAVYMALALIEAFAMTLVINALTGRNTRPN